MVTGGGRWEVGVRAEGAGHNFLLKTEGSKEADSICQGKKYALLQPKLVVMMASRRHVDEHLRASSGGVPTCLPKV